MYHYISGWSWFTATNITLFNNGNPLRIMVWLLSLYYMYHVQLTIACVFTGWNRSCSEVWQCQCCWQDDSVRVWCQGWSEINLLISHFHFIVLPFCNLPTHLFPLNRSHKIILCTMSFNVFMRIILFFWIIRHYYHYYSTQIAFSAY